MTREKLDGLLTGLDRLGLGAGDGSVFHKPQPTRSDAVLMSAVPVPFIRSCILTVPSSLERIKVKLKDITDRFENMGPTWNGEDARVVPGLMDDVRNAVTDFQVSGNTQLPGRQLNL